MPVDRSLGVTVTITGAEASDGSYSVTSVTYVQTGSTPNMPGLVDPSGDIDLQGLVPDPNYNWGIDITLTLVATITDLNGNNVPCIWAEPLTDACVITGPDGGHPNCMVLSQSSPTVMMIANTNDERHKPRADRTYSYKLGVMLPSVNNYFIGLDPKITNTGPTSTGP